MSPGKLSALYSGLEPPLEPGSHNLITTDVVMRAEVGKWRREREDGVIRQLKSTVHVRRAGMFENPFGFERAAAYNHTGEADIDLTPEIPRSIDRRCYTWSHPLSTLHSPCQSILPPRSPPEDAARRVEQTRGWRVWGLTHGLTAANPWILVVAAAPCRTCNNDEPPQPSLTPLSADDGKRGRRVTRWRGGLRGQTFQSHPDGETRWDTPAIGSPSVLVSILVDLIPIFPMPIVYYYRRLCSTIHYPWFGCTKPRCESALHGILLSANYCAFNVLW